MLAEPKVEVELASRVPSPALSLSMTGGPSSPALSSLPVLSFQLPPHLAHLSHLAQDGSSSPIVLQHSGEEMTFVDIDTPFSSDSKYVLPLDAWIRIHFNQIKIHFECNYYYFFDRSYLAATSRQNLETIVEAIRHLEGDHLFNDESSGSRKGQLVEVEIDTESIGCSLVVTSSQDEVHDVYITFTVDVHWLTRFSCQWWLLFIELSMLNFTLLVRSRKIAFMKTTARSSWIYPKSKKLEVNLTASDHLLGWDVLVLNGDSSRLSRFSRNC